METIFELVEDAIKRNPSTDRAFLSIEYKEWDKADTLLEAVLDEEPRNAIAYLGKVMIAERVSDLESLTDISEATKASPDYQRMVRFADDNVKAVLNAIEEKKQEREKEEETRKQETLKEADGLSLSTKEEELKKAVSLYKSLDGWSDSEEKAQKAEKRLQDLETVYVKMIDRFNASESDEDYLEVVKYLQPVGEYKHAKQIAAEAEKRAKAYKEQQAIKRADMLLRRGDLASLKEAERIYASIEGQEGKLSECRKRIEAYCTLQYSEALRLMAEGTEYSYTRAIQALNGIPDWRDSRDLIKRCERSIEDLKEKERDEQERRERELAETEEVKKSKESEEENTTQKVDAVIKEIEEDEKEERRTVKDKKKSSKTKVVLLIGLLLIIGGGLVYCFVTPLHTYIEAGLLAKRGEYEKAISLYEDLGDYRDSQVQWSLAVYGYGLKLVEGKKYDEAITQFRKIGNRDCSEEIEACKRNSSMLKAREYIEKGDFKSAVLAIGKYDDAELRQMMADHLVPYLERVERGESLGFEEKKNIGWVLLNTIEWQEIKRAIKSYPAASFSLIVYEDKSYADVALYYIKQGGNALSEDIIFDVEFMKVWSGEWISSVRDGMITKVISYEFQITNDEVLARVTSGRGRYNLKKDNISNIYYLNLNPESQQDEPIEINNDGNEMILRFKYSFGSRPIRFQRKEITIMKDPEVMANEVSTW